MNIETIKQKDIYELTKEETEYLYLTLNMSIRSIADMFNLKSQKKVQILIKRYELIKTPELIKKARETTNMLKYGTIYAILTNESRQKSITAIKSKQTTEKRLKTMKEKYGVQSVFSLPEVRTKIKNTIQNKYNTDNVMHNKDIIEKSKNNRVKTNINKYGVENQFQRKEIQEKRNKTLLNKYGTDNIMDVINIKTKKMQTVYEKNNLDFNTYNILNNKDAFISYINTYSEKPTIQEISENLKVSNSRIRQLIREYKCKALIDYFPKRSSFENELYEYITQDLNIENVERNNRTILNGKELDLYIPDYEIAIEFNGTYWHSTICLSDYKTHYKKSIECEKANIRLIHIYEYEWINKKDIIKSLLKIVFGKVNNKIYARNCEIREITNHEAKDFNNMNHLQGHRNAKITYGLFYENILVQLMSFSPHKKYEWEIIRSCPESNNIIIGGVSKLFNYFVKMNNPSSAFSYCDFNKFDGVSYEKLGMEFIGYTGPDKKWIVDGEVVNRNPAKNNYFKENAEAEIWGAGSKKYLWKK